MIKPLYISDKYVITVTSRNMSAYKSIEFKRI